MQESMSSYSYTHKKKGKEKLYYRKMPTLVEGMMEFPSCPLATITVTTASGRMISGCKNQWVRI